MRPIVSKTSVRYWALFGAGQVFFLGGALWTFFIDDDAATAAMSAAVLLGQCLQHQGAIRIDHSSIRFSKYGWTYRNLRLGSDLQLRQNGLGGYSVVSGRKRRGPIITRFGYRNFDEIIAALSVVCAQHPGNPAPTPGTSRCTSAALRCPKAPR